jgi:TolB-like protein
VAILFMEPRSRNAADSLLAEGLTLEIINTLSGVARLDVRSRWVSRRIAADPDPMRGARALGVDYLVDGVLELDSARVLVRGALTRTSTGRVVRPIRIERRRAEIEGLQVAVAQEVAAAVVGRLLPAERARFVVRPVDPRVVELALRARALSEQYTVAANRQAIVFARQAIEIDSAYAPAWARLAFVYGLHFNFVPDSAAVYGRLVMEASERALALDAANGTAMLVIAGGLAVRNDLSPRTEALARRGAAQEPGAESGLSLAYVLLVLGKVDEALAVSRAAVRRDSLAPLAWVFAASRFFQARHFVEAAGAWEHVLALRPTAPDSFELWNTLRWTRLEMGDCGGALAAGQTAPRDIFLIIESLRCLDRTAEADSIIDSQLALSSIHPGIRAVLLAWRRQPDDAFAVLERAFPPQLGLTLQHPAFDPYRRHAAYLALRRRMGL